MVQKAAEQDNALACANLGLLFEKEEKYEDAIYWFIKASDLSYADAQYIVGTYFEKARLLNKTITLLLIYTIKLQNKGKSRSPHTWKTLL